jgi:hypothetical protein
MNTTGKRWAGFTGFFRGNRQARVLVAGIQVFYLQVSGFGADIRVFSIIPASALARHHNVHGSGSYDVCEQGKS